LKEITSVGVSKEALDTSFAIDESSPQSSAIVEKPV
jgi:hypothetical protein